MESKLLLEKNQQMSFNITNTIHFPSSNTNYKKFLVWFTKTTKCLRVDAICSDWAGSMPSIANAQLCNYTRTAWGRGRGAKIKSGANKFCSPSKSVQMMEFTKCRLLEVSIFWCEKSKDCKSKNVNLHFFIPFLILYLPTSYNNDVARYDVQNKL